MNSINELKDSRFKSYIDETDLENICLNDSQKTKLLDGETLVHEAQNVLMYTPLSDRQKGILGILTVTTFKLSFATASKESEDDCYRPNILLGMNDVCLSCIDTIYQVGDRSKKKLTPGHNLSCKVKELVIVCKNMRVFSFSFKHADKDHGRNIANALLHHAYPKKHHLLFAYENKEPYYKPIIKDVRYYVTSDDWRKELEKTKSNKYWRISDFNNNFHSSHHLPQHLVVPKSLIDSDISRRGGHFRNGGVAFWVWGTENASLVRMAELLPTITDQSEENYILGQVHKSHPHKKQPEIMVLSKDCPQAKDVQNSYIKLRELCIPDSVRIFKAKDFKFYGLLESSRWLQHVSTCLAKSAEAAQHIFDKTTVVLQEDKGQDLNCVVSSLIQLLLDPSWRTRKGFQCLIQKEWVAAGHPFAYRLGHILDAEIEPAPIFLLFLDCVWQLLQQFPIAFQFTETYLTTIWDSAHISVFDTFLFNSEHDRQLATTGQNPIVLRSVWDWNEQFSDDDQVLFNNPLYDRFFTSRLIPGTGIPSLDIWRQCYFRWLPDLEIRNGGKPQIDLFNRFLAEEIDFLKHILRNRDKTILENTYHTKEENMNILKHVHSFYPFSRNYGHFGGALSVNNDLLSGDALDNQSILNLNTE